jgi:CcmD family protein
MRTMKLCTLTAAAALAAALVFSPAATPAAAQDAPAYGAQAQTPPAAAADETANTEATQALRRTAQNSAPVNPPRTLRAYWHVFVAFAVAWALVFGYTLSLGRRFRRLEDQLTGLETGAAR